MKKRLLSTLLALCMALALLPGTAGAFSEGSVGQNRTISSGYGSTAAIDEADVLWMWGDNRFGTLGNGGTGNEVEIVGWENDYSAYYQTVPQKIMDDVVSVTTGGKDTGTVSMTAAIKTDGSLWLWGYEGQGTNSVMGNTTINYHSSGEWLIQTVPYKLADDVSAVSVGGYYNAYIKTNGSLWVWGADYGEEWSTPTKVMDDVISVCVGPSCVAAIKSDHSLWLWGDDNGFWNDSDADDEPGLNLSPTPEKVMDDVASVSIGANYRSGNPAVIAAIKTDGSLWMWGENSRGVLGIDSSTKGGSSIPLKIMDDVTAVSTSWSSTAVIKTDGSLWMWGMNHFGQLGNGSTEDTSVPVKVMDDVTEVEVGTYYAIARKKDGSIWTWGSNSSGELGNGGKGNATNQYGTVYQTVPVQIDFSDITDKSTEMQKAIKYLAAHGIVMGSGGTNYSPNDSISRAELTALVLRALGKVDSKATSTFTDVTQANWYYATAASSQKLGYITGFEDNTFRGTTTINKEQIVVVAARVLGGEMNYKTPSNIATYLSKYSDTVVSWAQPQVALATRENLVVYRTDGTFSGAKNMTRGDAAIIIYRLFQRIW